MKMIMNNIVCSVDRWWRRRQTFVFLNLLDVQ